MPTFILSSDHVDWKQPVLIYLLATMFKMLGITLLTFKLANVLVALISLVLTYFLLREFFNAKLIAVGLAFFITTPMLIISARIGTETIMPLLFCTAWLLSLVWYRKTSKALFLMLAAFSLGVGFYSFKGMRLIVPPYVFLTSIYVVYKKRFTDLFFFTICLTPFFLITPFLEQKYSGSIYDRKTIVFDSYQHQALYWFSNLSPSFLFVEGEIGKIFSVGLFGVFLLGTLPFFLAGIKAATDKMSFFTFILAIFICTPILFGLAGSLGYGHRLLAMVPSFLIILVLGFKTLSKHKKTCIFLLILLAFNFLDFVKFYYFKYPTLNDTKSSFGNNLNDSFMELAKLAKQNNKTPYVQNNIFGDKDDGNRFFEIAYFKGNLNKWVLGQPLPENSILLTEVDTIQGMKKVSSPNDKLSILFN
jgi:4-amino-4-deoxy-L-arabinose transferase-like glycosyltransferase